MVPGLVPGLVPDLVPDLVAGVWLSYHSGMSEQVVTTHVDVDGDQDPRSVALITLDDGKANALSRSMIADVRTALTAAEADPNCIAAVIAGREGRFSAGFDLSVIQAGDSSEVVAMVADGGELVRHIYGATVPVVAACTGHALAAGALMLLGADIRVGAEGPFKIGLNEVAIGMTLPDWAYTIVRERISKRHLQRSITNARITDPTAAVDVGFLDRVVPWDQVVAAAVEEAVSLAALDTKAYGRMMREFRGETLVTMADQIAAYRN
ncbi:MAG: enoyl-CoA hydratase, partial [Thermoproteota archaeon]